ncbi:MAG: hypothetical protein V3T05_01485 [Myxococcota bacterium]
MWGLIRIIVGAAILGVAAYAFFFIDLGGKSFAGHVSEIWEAPVVQKKVDELREGVRQEIEEKMARAGEKTGRKLARVATGQGKNEFSDEDRRALDDLIETAGHAQ